MRVSKLATFELFAECWIGGAVGRTLERRVGNAPVDELGASTGILGRSRGAVAQGDHAVESLGAELVEVFGPVASMSMPARAMTRTALGCSGLGWLPALAASTVPSDIARLALRRSATVRCCPCTGTAPGVDDASSARRSALGTASCSAGCSAPPGVCTSRGTPEVDRVVAVAAVRRAALCGDEPALVEQAQVVRHEALRLVDQRHQFPHGSIALHQFRSNRHRSGCAASRTNRGGSPPSGSAVVLGCTTSRVVDLRDINQSHLMDRGRLGHPTRGGGASRYLC